MSAPPGGDVGGELGTASMPGNEKSSFPDRSGQNAGCLCDVSGPGAGITPNERFLATYSVSKNGTGFFGGETVSVTNGTTTYYIDESPLDTHPAVTVVQQ